jgi:hypothetical protein
MRSFRRSVRPSPVLAAFAAFLAAVGGQATARAPDYFTASFRTERVLDWGERPDWSPDGRRIVFTDAENDGQLAYAFELDVATRKVRCLTCHFGPDLGKVVRIYHLPDGNFLVTRGQDPRSESPFNAGIHWLAKAMDRPPVYLGAGAMGDIAIAEKPANGSVAIAWGSRQADGDWALTTGRINLAAPDAGIGDRRVVYRYTAARPGKTTFAEAYNLAADGKSLTFFTIERPTPNGEMYRIDLASGALTNLSNSPQHNEAHLFPDERFALEESNRASDPDGPLRGISTLPPPIIPWLLEAVGMSLPAGTSVDPKAQARFFDLHVVAYDGTNRIRRLTHVSDLGGDAHQSEPSPDGRRIVYCIEERSSPAMKGKGGLYIGTFQ